MKKITALILVFIMAVSLCACGNVAEIPVPTEPPKVESEAEQPTADIAESTPEEVKTDYTVIARFKTDFSVFSDPKGDGVEILEYSVETPEIEVVGNAESTKAINSRIAEINASYYPGEEGGSLQMDRQTEMLSLAEDNYMYYESGAAGDELNLKFTFTRTAEIARADADFILLKYTNSIVMNDSSTEEEFYAFNTQTGELDENYSGSTEVLKETGTLQAIPIDEFSGSGEIIDLILIDEDGDDYLYGPEPGTSAENVLVDGYWYCNKMTDSYVQIRVKST